MDTDHIVRASVPRGRPRQVERQTDSQVTNLITVDITPSSSASRFDSWRLRWTDLEGVRWESVRSYVSFEGARRDAEEVSFGRELPSRGRQVPRPQWLLDRWKLYATYSEHPSAAEVVRTKKENPKWTVQMIADHYGTGYNRVQKIIRDARAEGKLPPTNRGKKK